VKESAPRKKRERAAQSRQNGTWQKTFGLMTKSREAAKQETREILRNLKLRVSWNEEKTMRKLSFLFYSVVELKT